MKKETSELMKRLACQYKQQTENKFKQSEYEKALQIQQEKEENQIHKKSNFDSHFV